MILLIGATGRVGSAAARALLASKRPLGLWLGAPITQVSIAIL